MRIVGKNNAVLATVTLCLTPEEAKELMDSVADLIANPETHHHHISSNDYQTEITVAVYTKENFGSFDPALQKIIGDVDEHAL